MTHEHTWVYGEPQEGLFGADPEHMRACSECHAQEWWDIKHGWLDDTRAAEIERAYLAICDHSFTYSEFLAPVGQVRQRACRMCWLIEFKVGDGQWMAGTTVGL